MDLIKEEAEKYQQMGKDLIHLIEQMQLIVKTSLEQINKENLIQPASFNPALQKINAHIQSLSAILHKNN